MANIRLLWMTEDRKNCIIDKAENNLKDILNNGGNWIAEYKRIRVIGMKE